MVESINKKNECSISDEKIEIYQDDEEINKEIEDKIEQSKNILNGTRDSQLFVIALTKRDKNNLKKSIYEVIINTLLILNQEQRKLSGMVKRKGIYNNIQKSPKLKFHQCNFLLYF
jgi:hypothetical protein